MFIIHVSWHGRSVSEMDGNKYPHNIHHLALVKGSNQHDVLPYTVCKQNIYLSIEHLDMQVIDHPSTTLKNSNNALQSRWSCFSCFY
jgi:hypothetical protein